jgi:hypothetical protein
VIPVAFAEMTEIATEVARKPHSLRPTSISRESGPSSGRPAQRVQRSSKLRDK